MVSMTGSAEGSLGARTWRPILDGPAAAEARSAIEAIASSLPGSLPALGATAAPLARHVGLNSGRAGLALCSAYLARSTDEPAAIREADRQLAGALQEAPAASLAPGLFAGLAGVAWAVAHLQRLGLAAGGPAEPFGEWAVATLADALGSESDAGALVHYDLISGLVGVGVAALEQLPAPAAVGLLERIVERLSERAKHRPDGVTWWTAPEHTGQADRMPNGWYNLGVAHGVPGAIAFLGLVCAAGIAPTVARPLLDGAVSWLLAQRRRFETGARFPKYIADGREPIPGRLIWCYGDPGIAAALLVAARAVGEAAWEREAVALALTAAGRPPEASGIVDAPLCHGAIGLGHVFNRLGQHTGEARLTEAARFWLARGLAMRRPGGKLGGFHAVLPADDGRPTRRIAFRGLLEGAAGIGLALLAATTDVKPTWDRVLLLS